MRSKQRGFTLLEALVALVLFAILVSGSALTMKHLLRTQTEVHVSSIVLDQMQERLQGVVGNPSSSSGDVCASINKNAFTIDGKTFHIACHTKTSTVAVASGVTVNLKWPILAASSTSQAEADGCADASAVKDTCYIVGN